MNLPRLLLRLALGRRLPTTSGELRVPGITSPVTIRRDKWGVPHVDAASDADAFFAQGFCHGQDRAGQLELLWRVVRGRLAEWVGADGLPVDRFSRRVGFRRAAERQVPVLSPEARGAFDAYARGVTAGATLGLPRKAHEFAVLGGGPSAWDAADVLAVLKLQSFLLPSNWDVELARLRLLRSDGPAAVEALDPVGQAPSPRPPPPGGEGASVTPSPPGGGGRGEGSSLLDLLAQDLAAVHAVLPRGGGSNNWAVAGTRTASGKPLLANDPHLGPTVPPPWHLAHVRTPDWEVMGAALVGAPSFPIGHNGFAAWGVTAGLTDNTDLFLETLGPDGMSVREPDGSFTPCDRHREVIRVKGRPDVTEEVLETPRGPVITPLLDGVPEAVSLRAVWLDPLPADGFLSAMKAKSFDDFRRPFARWPLLPLNVVYADAGGTVGYQLIGQLPRRKGGHGLLPRPADRPDSGWEADHVPFDRMPHLVNPPGGSVATANAAPHRLPGDPYLGLDFVDDYRAAVIGEELAKRDGWDPAAFAELQQNVRSKPWEEMRAAVLSLTPDDPDAREALALLRDWDGQVAADSPAAAVFELAVAELCTRVAKAKAPGGWAVALGATGLGADGHNLFADRRVGHLVRLVNDQPPGWFARPWADEIADALAGVVRRLRREAGPGPAYWGWGHLRPLRLDHPLFGKHKLLGPAFDLGPVPHGGDQNTVNQGACRPLDPLGVPQNIPNLRAVFDLADPSKSTFVLAGGQSGNPLSPHFADQLPPWQAGEAITPPWAQEQVIREAKEVLRLLPGG
jgi:penicillin amidase